MRDEYESDKCNWYRARTRSSMQNMTREHQVSLKLNGKGMELLAYVVRRIIVLEVRKINIAAKV